MASTKVAYICWCIRSMDYYVYLSTDVEVGLHHHIVMDVYAVYQHYDYSISRLDGFGRRCEGGQG